MRRIYMGLFGSLTLWFHLQDTKPSGDTVPAKSFKALRKSVTSNSGNAVAIKPTVYIVSHDYGRIQC